MTLQAQSRKEKEVWQACDELASEKALITYQAVGDRLVQLGYRRGSNSDIYRYLTSWKKMQGRKKTNQQEVAVLKAALAEWDADLAETKARLQALEAQLSEEHPSIGPELAERIQVLIHSVLALSKNRDQELIKLYDHHQRQFDRYLQAMSAARERNGILVSQLRSMRLAQETLLREQAPIKASETASA